RYTKRPGNDTHGLRSYTRLFFKLSLQPYRPGAYAYRNVLYALDHSFLCTCFCFLSWHQRFSESPKREIKKIYVLPVIFSRFVVNSVGASYYSMGMGI